jgi:hypothetical protein
MNIAITLCKQAQAQATTISRLSRHTGGSANHNGGVPGRDAACQASETQASAAGAP